MLIKFLKQLLIATFFLFSYDTNANELLIEKAKRTAHEAFSQAGGGPERHRALITAYWVNEGDCVLDLGSHHGTYALFYSRLVGQSGTVIAYEASPPIYDYMANRVTSLANNIIPRNRAVSDSTDQILRMKIYPHDTGHQSCTVEPIHWNEERMPGDTAMVEVLTEKSDDFVKINNFAPIRFIKIDTEGHEHAVLRGAEEILLTQRPLVIFEYGFHKGHWEPDTIRQVEELGYVCYDCNTDERAYPGHGMLSIPYLQTDLLAIPVEFEKEIVEVLPYLH